MRHVQAGYGGAAAMLFEDASRLTDAGGQLPRTVVIGAGAVGLYAAAQLAAAGQPVVVIEAGTRNLSRFAAESWQVAGHPHDGVRLGRGRGLGGTTSLWGGQLVEFQPIDFAGRSWLPHSAWPVSYEEIAPYYPATYRNLGVPERLTADETVWRGVSCARPELGPEFEVFFTRWMSTPNFAQLFAKQIQSDERLAVLTGYTAVGFRSEGGRVQAVRVANEAGQSHWLQGDRFLLAAGTIENARLLLHAAQDAESNAPWRGNPNLGRFFQDHVGGRIGTFHPANKKEFFRMFCNVAYAGQKFQPKVRLRNEVLARERIYNTQAFFGFESEISEHLVYLKQFLKAALYGRKPGNVLDLFRKSAGMARYLLPLMWKYVWDHRVFVPGTAKILLRVQAEHAPLAESCLRVDEEHRDATGLPRVVVDWRLGGDELESIRRFAVQLRDAMRALGVGELRIDEDLLALKPEFLTKLGDTYHQSGGAVMGRSEQDGVVDRNLRVFGTENVYVAGASVFRTTSNANVTFTALAFTTRLVEHLLGGQPGSDERQTLAGTAAG